MANIYDFASYHRIHLLEKSIRQVALIRRETAQHQTNLQRIGDCLDDHVKALISFDEKIRAHRLSCEKTARENEEILRAIETGDIDQCVDYRDRLKRIRRGNE